MEKFFLRIIKHRKIILILAVIALALAGYMITQTNLNTDVARYLPDNSASKRTVTILREDFGINGDAEICAAGTSADFAEIEKLVADITALDDVSAVQWLGSYEGLFAFDEDKLISAEPSLPDENVNNVLRGLYFEYDGETYYTITISLTAANATAEAGDALEKIENVFDAYSKDYYLGGTATQGNNMIKTAFSELPQFLIVAVIIIMVILLIATPSVSAALIILLTIGISIIFNLGTNFFTEDISMVTFSVAAILQLALSMDYSIFLTHAFETARKENDDVKAMLIALKKTLVVIIASAATTIAGFCALLAMKYTMGMDLGLCLAKGVTLSFLTVINIQPCLMLCFRKFADKTQHKTLDPAFKWLRCVPEKLRVAAPVCALILLIPAFFLSNNVKYYYLDSHYDTEAVGPKAASQATGTQAIFVCETGSTEKQLKLAELIKNLDGVSSVTGYYSLIQDLAHGLTLPVYSSLTDQNKDTLMFELELTPELLLATAEGNPTAIEDAISSEISSYATKMLPSMITDATAAEAASLGRTLTAGEQQAVQDRVVADYSAELQALVTQQLEPLQHETDSFMGEFGEYKDKFFSEIDGKEYTFFTVKILGEPEGEKALAMVTSINNTTKFVLGTDTIYSAGNSQSVKDLAETTGTDLLIVNALSALLILIILLLTFKEFFISILLILLIELAIFINLSISTLTGNAINFMSYIIISAIQLGATIDYAILMTKTYRMELEKFSPYEAIDRSIHACAFPIITSVSILCGACLSVYFISTDTIIREITMLIARGSFISGVMVLFILPAILALVTTRKTKKN